MSKFHEAVRELLEDVQHFLTVTLNTEILSTTALSHREGLLMKLTNIRQDYPQLHLSGLSKPPPLTRFTSTNEKDSLGSPVPPSSPPPYVDMQGNGSGIIPTIESLDEDYEVCANDKSLLTKEYSIENKSLNDSEEIAPDEEREVVAVSAAELSKAEKSGYLEKKGKERLGGLLNPFQRRWCAIKDGILYYYERCTDRRQKGEIALAGYEVKPAPTATKDASKRNLCFELSAPGKRTFQFMAVTPKDLRQWMSAVERHNKSIPTANIPDNTLETGDIPKDGTVLPSIMDSDDEDGDDIYETVEETTNQPKSSVQGLNNNNEPSYNGESCNQTENEELYTDAESTTNDEWEHFNPQDWYVGLWDCKGDDKNELDFSRGDLIHIISKEYDTFAWWIGELKGRVGLVPKSYLMEAYEVIQ